MSKILVVDDQASIREIVRAYLETVHQCRVVEAVDGVDAVKKLLGETFDLVVTDLVMPGMNGLELVGYLRRDKAFKHLPVIMMTSQGEEKERRKAQALGVNDYLVKPFEPMSMDPLVQKHLKRP